MERMNPDIGMLYAQVTPSDISKIKPIKDFFSAVQIILSKMILRELLRCKIVV